MAAVATVVLVGMVMALELGEMAAAVTFSTVVMTAGMLAVVAVLKATSAVLVLVITVAAVEGRRIGQRRRIRAWWRVAILLADLKNFMVWMDNGSMVLLADICVLFKRVVRVSLLWL